MPLIQSFITDIKIDGKSYTGFASFFCFFECYYKNEDQYFHIKCSHDGEFPIEIYFALSYSYFFQFQKQKYSQDLFIYLFSLAK